MNLILFTKHSRTPRCLSVKHRHVFVIGCLFFCLVGLLFWGGYYTGKIKTQNQHIPEGWALEISSYQKNIEQIEKETEVGMQALSAHLGQLQSQIIRINALGSYLTELAGLDKGEFDFSKTPALGGPVQLSYQQETIDVSDFVLSLEELAIQLEDRENQLKIMESFYSNKELVAELVPSGRPIKKGWTSSYFGMRTDPFTGLQEQHNGFDFAGKEGSEIIASGAGVVTWAKKRYGYGNMVEINHGNGFVTRYAHNSKNLVNTGEVVKKGQVIALMGSSGRSTGPHVHYEVLYKTKVVDPSIYVYKSK